MQRKVTVKPPLPAPRPTSRSTAPRPRMSAWDHCQFIKEQSEGEGERAARLLLHTRSRGSRYQTTLRVLVSRCCLPGHYVTYYYYLHCK